MTAHASDSDRATAAELREIAARVEAVAVGYAALSAETIGQPNLGHKAPVVAAILRKGYESMGRALMLEVEELEDNACACEAQAVAAEAVGA